MKYMSALSFTAALLLSSWQPKTDMEAVKRRNYLIAVKNESTSNYYTVLKVRDLNTNAVKEVCTKGNFVRGAIHEELGLDYEEKNREKVLAFAKSKKDRYFEFRSKAALTNVSFYDYDEAGRIRMAKKYDMDSIVNVVNNRGEFSLRVDDKKAKWIAHELFNKGVLMQDGGCFGPALYYASKAERREMD